MGLALGLAPRAAWPESPRQHDLAKRETTRALMRTLLDGIFGGASGVGYLGDMGVTPGALEDLAAASGSPGYSTSHQGGVGMGYAGPYVARPGAASASFVDAWSTPLALETTATSVRLRSAGPDRDPSTTQDNVYLPLEPRTTHGVIEVSARSVPEGGGEASVLDDGDVQVRVYYAVDGVETSVQASYDSDAEVFRSTALHLGRHYVSVTALTSEDFSVVGEDDVVWLRGRRARTSLRLVLEGEGTVVCHDPSGKNPRTKTVGDRALSAHLGHGDTLGPCDGD